MAPGGGSSPEPDAEAEGALFVVGGELSLKLAGTEHVLQPGGFAYLPPGSSWRVQNRSSGSVHFHWIRKLYQRVPDIAVPDAIVTNENAIAPTPMPHTDGRWATTRFVDPSDIRHDMHITIVTFEPGASIPPFAETHVMEHGLYVPDVWKARPSTGSTRIGLRSRPEIICGSGPFALRPVTPAVRDASATCCIRTSTGTWICAP